MLHYGDEAYMGSSCQKKNTPRIPPNGMRSKLGAVRCSFTPPSSLLSTLRLRSTPLHLQTGLGWGYSVLSSAVCSWLCSQGRHLSTRSLFCCCGGAARFHH